MQADYTKNWMWLHALEQQCGLRGKGFLMVFLRLLKSLGGFPR